MSKRKHIKNYKFFDYLAYYILRILVSNDGYFESVLVTPDIRV